MVKLVWEDSGNGHVCARTTFGTYHVSKDRDETPMFVSKSPWMAPLFHGSMESGMARCENDWKKRLSLCLGGTT